MKGYTYLDNDRGLTLIELMVAITIAIVVLAPIYEVLLTGNKVQIKSFSQVDLQEKTQQVLLELVEGKVVDGLRTGGLRQASQAPSMVAVDTNKGIAFASAGKLVTYYLEDSKIFYKDDAYQGTVPLNFSGGSPVLENVQSFQIQEFIDLGSTKKSYQVTIHAAKALPANGQNAVTFSTRVVPRNQ